jgi:hypothetical protein
VGLKSDSILNFAIDKYYSIKSSGVNEGLSAGLALAAGPARTRRNRLFRLFSKTTS